MTNDPAWLKHEMVRNPPRQKGENSLPDFNAGIPVDISPEEAVDASVSFYKRRAPVNARRLDYLADHARTDEAKLMAIEKMNDRAMGKPKQDTTMRVVNDDSALMRIVEGLREEAIRVGRTKDLHLLDITPNQGETPPPTGVPRNYTTPSQTAHKFSKKLWT
jgi:hypothetical protein